MASPLTDLDELILRCRDQRAKAYLSEAVGSYKSGAFRAAIVATWIAVCFDFIDKLRELALSGDKEAEKQVEELEKTRKLGDVAMALKFERDLLTLARDKFELISHLEYIDLDRLQADRNRCAHPSLVSEEQAYTPSAELARAHIHAAVTHLLQHQPAQGKYALERLMAEVESEYFPTSSEQATIALSSGPLRKPRDSLARNFILLLLKRLLQEGASNKPRSQIVAALRAVGAMHRAHYVSTLKEKLTPLFRTVADADLLRCTQFLERVPDCWQFMEADVRQRIQNFVTALPVNGFNDLDFLLEYEPLKTAAEHRVRFATEAELKNLFFFDLPPKIADRLIHLYLHSTNFDQANELAKELWSSATDLSADHVRRIVTGAQTNKQVLHSFELGSLLSALRSRNKLPEVEFDVLLHEHGLARFAPAAPQPA
ncbi:MAG: hypothetical protein KJ946_05380 [Gammaproteobacteria bacterium]|nr:hypothetical protein [Gammaproteobacteria bacterium]